MTEELKTLLKRAFDEGTMYEATLSEVYSFTNFIKGLETEQLMLGGVTYCKKGRGLPSANE